MAEELHTEKPVKVIALELSETPDEMLPSFLASYASDRRKGVVSLLRRAEIRLEKYRAEQRRLDGMLSYERRYAAECPLICGIDEVGRGPLAGPVVAAAVILPPECRILYLNDSKKLSAARRDALFDEISEKALGVGIGVCSEQRIDEINILQATYEAMRQAIEKLPQVPDLLLNDAVTIPGVSIPQVPIIGGDGKSLSIAAASVIAKVTRDRLMEELDGRYPGYGFAANKGYGSAEHIAALQELGPSPIHRRTFISHFVGENTRETGTWYEAKAAALLEKNGYRILERNFRCRTGEADLIARAPEGLVFAEVKYRSGRSAGAPEEAVGISKQRRICSAARYYLMQRHLPESTPVRLDVIAFAGEDVRWHKNAFEWCL